MGLSIYYSSPPLTAAEQQQLDETRKNGTPHTEPDVMLDITHYVTTATWSGDADQAARKLSFEIAYNTEKNDMTFAPLHLEIGGFIYAFYAEDDAAAPVEIFCGRIFYRKRNTSQFTYSFVAYDDMIYLAKSRVQLIFSNVSVTDVIKQTCAEIGIPVADDMLQIPTVVNFIADGKSCTEIFRMLRDKTRADTVNYPTTGMDFTVVCLLDKVTVVQKGTVIEGYIASDAVNVDHTEHSQSIESMVNRVKAVDSVGRVCQVFTINDDVTHYGLIQSVYKMQPPRQGETVDNVKAAKENLEQIREESSLEGLGNIQCITGYSIVVQEEQLQGTFFIKSDTHHFADNVHTMSLTLEYMPDTPTSPVIEQQDVATPIFKSSGRGKRPAYSATGNLNVEQGLNAGWAAWGGQTMDNGRNGCAEAVGKIGGYYSPFLAQEANNGVVSVPNMVADADSAGLLQDFDAGSLEAGDAIVYGDDDHVVIYDGNGGYYGNSSSKMVTVHSRDYTDVGMTPTKIIKSSKG